MMLIPRLVAVAEIWASTHDRSLARLATIVVNDGKLFERISGGGSCTVATYERLMAHLRDPSNWAAPIPYAAARLLHVDTDATDLVSPSCGNAGEISTVSA